MTHDLFPTRPVQRRPEALPLQRASLDGLEVSESSFGEWLEAGGEVQGEKREPGGLPSTGNP